MDEKFKRFLPIGTVVLLRGGSKKIMITGYCAYEKENPNQMYDYNGCIYPEGYISSELVCLFNHKQIHKIYHLGYANEENAKWKEKLNEYVDKLDKGEEAVLEITE